MQTNSFIGELRNIVGESQVSVNRAGTEFIPMTPVSVNKGLTEHVSGATEKSERKGSPGCGTSDTVW